MLLEDRGNIAFEIDLLVRDDCAESGGGRIQLPASHGMVLRIALAQTNLVTPGLARELNGQAAVPIQMFRNQGFL